MPSEVPLNVENIPATNPLLTDHERAKILRVNFTWIRSHAREIPSFQRLGSYFRFRSNAIEQWLGNLDSCVNADRIFSFIHPGRYVQPMGSGFKRFLPQAEGAQ